MLQPKDPQARRNREAVRLAQARQLARSGEARIRRERARLTLHDVAAVIDRSHTTVLRWENGERTPTGDAALQWVDLMDRLDEAFREGAA